MTVVNLIGGIFLVLFGLRYLRKGFARLFGGDLLDWLQAHTRTRLRAFGGGIIAGTVMPSSTAMAFLSVDMTRDGKTSWANVLSVLLGAQVGFTVIVQFLTFGITDYAALFLTAGGILFLFFASARAKGLGQALLAFGFLLMGMGLLRGAALDLGNDPAVADLFAALGAFPLLVFLGGMVLTLLIQSSTASIAIGLGLAASGQVTAGMLFLWVLGTNIGLCLTVLAAGWSRREGRRLGLALLLIKVPVALLGVILLYLLPLENLEQSTSLLNRQAAWLHTGFNLFAGFGVLAASRLEGVVRRMVPDPDSPVGAESTSRLEPILLQHPTLAVNAALRETLRLFDILHVLRESAIDSLRSRKLEPDPRHLIRQRAEHTRSVREELVRFLDAIADDDLDVSDRTLKDTLDDFMRELPLLLRTLERDLPEEVMRLLMRSPEEVGACLPLVEEAALRCSQQMETVARMLMRQNPELGQEILARKQENSAWMIAAKRNHAHLPHPVWEIIDDFQQLNRRLSGVAYVYCSDLPMAEKL